MNVCFRVCQNLLNNILPSQDENQPTTRQQAASAAGQKCAAKGDADCKQVVAFALEWCTFDDV